MQVRLGATPALYEGVERTGETVARQSTFFHPDYTVGPGTAPGPALRLAGLAYALPPIGNFTLP